MSYLDRLKNFPTAQGGTHQNHQNPCEGGFVGFEGSDSGLLKKIRAMAERWQYAPDELAEALRLAEADPAGWQRLVTHDEAMKR